MSITESSEKPNPFNFPDPPPEESPSTPVCGTGEIVEPLCPPADILVSPVLSSGNTLKYTPTLFLSSEKSSFLEAQSVTKPNETPPVCDELVGVQGLAFLRRDIQPSSLEHESESSDQVLPRSEPIFDQTPKSFDVGSDKEEDEEIPLKWRSRGMRGANQSQIQVSELEGAKGRSAAAIVENSAEKAKERQRKGKGKLEMSGSKRDKRKYITRSEAQKVMGSAIAANKAHTERTRKRKREGIKPAQPASMPMSIENSDTESEDAVKNVLRMRREGEEEKIISKGTKKGGRKSTAKIGKEKIQRSLAQGKTGRKQRPGPTLKNQIKEKELTRKERIEKMEQQKVLNGRVFDPDINTRFGMGNLVDAVIIQGWNHLFAPPVPYLHEPEVREFFYKMELLEGGGITTTVRNVEIHLDEETLGIILGVPVVGVRTIEGCKPSTDFSKLATKRGDVKRAGLPKKFLKGEYQLMFEFINKVMVPRTEKRTVASAADLFLMEKLDELEEINLPAIMLEHMHRVMTWKNAKHGIPYGYLLNFVFNHFEVPVGRGVPGTAKQMFTMSTLLECECIEGPAKGRSQVADVLEQQAILRREVTDLTKILCDKEVEITRLKSELQKAVSRGPGTSDGQDLLLKELRDENTTLLKTNASLNEEIKSLNKQLIQAHESANERMLLLMRTLNPSPPPS
ncbi:hypothetical protein KY290_037249 [Solanum tuberosum]|uniref:Putative plant transposon protein domain-containing protein n=1 Tax=Solanum tuberosum TaxID=4113 RepID=A0ABQ7TWV4_SOLTU|nr:hypothetical protein KY290_037249 [Solanum tuberosum]